ncbi:MAG: 50S ribosomal protein L15 [bacterium]|nr:50S ribosomal protein L15 [bacterium]
MQLHQLNSKTNFRRGQRIGRGGKRGKTSGRGTKGQKSRAGHKIRPAIRDIIKKLPKLRGYKFKSFAKETVVINLKDLERHFQSGDTINSKMLIAKGLVNKIKGQIPRIKILGAGKIEKKFIFKDVVLSGSVREKMK